MVRLTRALSIAVLIASSLPFAHANPVTAIETDTEFAFTGTPGPKTPIARSGYTQTVSQFAPDPATPNRVVLSLWNVHQAFQIIRLEAPNAVPLVSGATFTDARTLDHYVAGKAVFDTGHMAFNCDDVRTGFTVHTIEFDGDGLVSKLDLSFEIRCPGETAAVHGEVRIGVPARRLKMIDWSPTDPIPPDWKQSEHAVIVGASSQTKTITVTGVGKAPTTFGTIETGGSASADWLISSDECSGKTLAEGETCTFDFTFAPTSNGMRPADIVLQADVTTGPPRIAVDAAAKLTTVTTVEVSPNPALLPDTPVAKVTVSPDPHGGVACVRSGASPYTYTCVPMGAGGVTYVTAFPHWSNDEMVYGYFPGTELLGESISGPAQVITGATSKVTLMSSMEPQESPKTVTLTATVLPWQTGGSIFRSGTLTIRDTTTGTVLGTQDIATSLTLSVTVALSIGTHELIAEYSGEPLPNLIAPSSATLTQHVTPDATVAVTGAGISSTSIYPVVDSFRDTVSFRGTLGEPATVTVRIVSTATGKAVRTASLGTLLAGPYAWAWNGRNNVGTLQPAGKYTMTQTITDSFGNKVTATGTVTLSMRKVTWKTVTYTRKAGAWTAKGGGVGAIITGNGSTYSGGVVVGSPGVPSWAATIYSFKLPTAPGYRTITFRVTGRTKAGETSWVGVWAPARGNYLYVDTYDTWKPAGKAYGTYSTVASGPTHAASGYASGILLSEGSYGVGAHFDAASVKMTVVYAVWAK